MMSQKSLRNKVNGKDFLRSFGDSLLFPLIAFVVLLASLVFPIVGYFTSESFKATAFHNEISIFSERWGFEPELLVIGMVLCGILTAIKSFAFIMNKKQVNVYFSLGMKRSTMFLNRTAASMILLVLASFIPLTISYILNIVYLGVSAHLTQVYLYLVALFVTSSFIGFAIGSFASSVAGNLFESGLTSVSISALPFAAAYTFFQMMNRFLNGHDFQYEAPWLKLFTPFTFGIDLDAKPVRQDIYGNAIDTYYNPLSTLMRPLTSGDVAPDKFKIPEALVIDRWWMLPIVIWFAVAVLLTIGALILFKKRRAEHANSFGHFKIATGINSTMVYACVVAVIATTNAGKYYQPNSDSIVLNPYFWLVMGPVATFIAYFLAQLIMKRKFKPALKSLALYGVLLCVTAFGFVTVKTEMFGTYNKLPEKSEIKSVQISLHDGPFTNYVVNPYEMAVGGFPETISEDATDIEMVTKVFDSVRKDKKDEDFMITPVNFVITEKNGREIRRSFEIYSEDIYFEYMRAVYGSNYFDKLLKDRLLEQPKQEETNGFEGDYIGKNDVSEPETSFRNNPWAYYDDSFIAKANDDGVWENNVKDTEALCDALYKDLSRMDYDSICHNSKRPIGALSVDSNILISADFLVKNAYETSYSNNGFFVNEENHVEMENIQSVGYRTFYLYPEMTNTINYLESEGLLNMDTYNAKIKEVYYTDSPIFLTATTHKIALEQNPNMYDGEPYDGGRRTDNFAMGSEINTSTPNGAASVMDENATLTDYIKKAYVNYEHPLIAEKDEAEINKIVGASVPYYAVLSDKGRYVYIVYENGPIVCEYLPEANAGVLK